MKEKIFRTVSCIFLVLAALSAALLLVGCDQESGCEHTWGEWKTETAATCVSGGTQKRICVVCKESETKEIPATGSHAFGTWETLIRPTVLKEGEKKRTCACGATENKKIPVLEGTEGLGYALINDGAAYEVYGIGAATDTDIIIPATFEGKPVIGIGNSAFYGCSNLTSITFFENITRIENWAFSECSSLTEITILVSVTAIGAYAFEECSSLTSITIPDSVTAIGDAAFAGCSSLISITIPGSVTAIGADTFEDCSSLTSIVIPAGVTEIGSSAFYNCNALAAVYITDLTAWCNISFDGTASNPCYYADALYLNGELITNLVIPGSVAAIGKWAFYGFNGLTSITIPASVTAIDKSAFNGCSGLTSIVVENGNAVYHSEGNCLIETATNTLVLGCKNSDIPDYVTIIATNAFRGCSGLRSITIPVSVTSIYKNAFNGCSALTSVIFENASGWQQQSTSSAATSISSSDLANAATAATYLTSTYCNCFWNCLSSGHSQEKVTEGEWRAAFTFENVRVDCTTQAWGEEPSAHEPICGGTHYLFDGETVAVANGKKWIIGSEEPIICELLYEKRQNLVRLFKFGDCFGEFILLEDGTYFCLKSSLKDIMWVGDYIEDVYVTFTDGQVSKISYTYRGSSLAPPIVYTFTFSQYGQVVLEAPIE